MLITVKVENQWILLPIGWYPEEWITKTELEISVALQYRIDFIEDDLSNTIDYQRISERILDLKNQPYKLLEFAAQALIENLEDDMSYCVDLQFIRVEFKKKNIAHAEILANNHSILVEKNYTNP